MNLNFEFTDEMRKTLAKMKDETFESYECVRERTMWAMWTLRINLETFSVDLYNEETLAPGFIEGGSLVEEVGKFWCCEVKKDSKFDHGVVGEEAHCFLIGEKIKSVKIVNDFIKDKGRDFEISIDQALLIETKNNKISFYRSWIFDEYINIHVARDKFMMQPVEEVADEWCVNEQGVEVNRTIVEL